MVSEMKKLSQDKHYSSDTYLKIVGLFKTQIMVIRPPAGWRALFVDMSDVGQTKSPF